MKIYIYRSNSEEVAMEKQLTVLVDNEVRFEPIIFVSDEKLFRVKKISIFCRHTRVQTKKWFHIK